jgi:hypothetical protein
MIYILYIGIYYIIHTYFDKVVQNTGHSYYNDTCQETVHDFFHEILPDWSEDEWITNIIVLLSIIPMFFTNSSFQLHFISMLIVVYLIRDITINLTILPKHKNCIKHNKWYQHITGGCYDKIFSGHFSLTYLLTLFYYSYGIITNIPLLVSWNIVNAFTILLTRSHYTIDIVMAFFVCSFIFSNNITIPIPDLT